jgi:hypothetical protein
MGKINEIINTIDGNSVKIYSSNGDHYVELTVSDDGQKLIAKNGNGVEKEITNFTS